MSEEDDEEPRISQQQFDILQRRATYIFACREYEDTFMSFSGGYMAVVRDNMTYTFSRNNRINRDISPDDLIKLLDKK